MRCDIKVRDQERIEEGAMDNEMQAAQWKLKKARRQESLPEHPGGTCPTDTLTSAQKV